MTVRYIANDLVKVYESTTSRTAIETLFWGDAVDFVRMDGARAVINFHARDKLGNKTEMEAYLSKGAELDERPLIVRFLDVGQGDGASSARASWAMRIDLPSNTSEQRSSIRARSTAPTS